MRKIVAIFLSVLLIIDGFLPSIYTGKAYGDDFSDAVASGSALGTQNRGDYSPQNLNTTLGNSVGSGTSSSSIVPAAGAASNSQSTYENFYTSSTETLGAAASNTLSNTTTNSASETTAASFVSSSYSNASSTNLSKDPTYGNTCLATDGAGNCTQWSSSTSSLFSNAAGSNCTITTSASTTGAANTYTCSGTAIAPAIQTCTVSDGVRVDTTQVTTGPCSNISATFEPGQIYESCFDIFNYYEILSQTNVSYTDDCKCYHHPGAFACNTGSGLTFSPPISPILTPSSQPAGATYLGTSYDLTSCQQQSGWDKGTYNTYNWYAIYDHSVITQVVLLPDASCDSTNLTKWENSCTMTELDMCNSSGQNCIIDIQNGQATGNLPSWNYSEVVSTAASQPCSSDSSCMVSGDADDGYSVSCASSESCVGSCPSSAVSSSAPTPSDQQSGTLMCNVDSSNCSATGSSGFGSPIISGTETYMLDRPYYMRTIQRRNGKLPCLPQLQLNNNRSGNRGANGYNYP